MSQLLRIYKDELLKSYIERVYRMNAYSTLGVLFEELFGERVLRIHSYVPSHIERIVGGLGGCFTPENLIEQHSLYNFYIAFQGQEVEEDIKRKMLIDKGNAYKITKYNEILLSQYYRYCPLCVKEQLEQYGDFSWNRIHQIAPVCTKHHVWIEESLFPLKYKLNDYIKHWRQLDLAEMCEAQRDNNRNNTDMGKAIEISKLIEQLILGKYRKDITLESLRSAYMYQLKEKELVYPSGESIQITELKYQIETYFTKELLSRIGIDVEKCVTRTVNRYIDTVHPLYHVIMLIFLQIDIDKEIPADTRAMPNIPVYCLNPLSNHKNKHQIDDIKVHYDSRIKQHMCTFSCSCGYVYTTNLQTVNSSKGTKVGNIKSYGKVYEENLIKLRHLGIKGIARKTGINHGTIRKQLRNYDKFGSINGEDSEGVCKKQNTIKRQRRSEINVNNAQVKWKEKDKKYYELTKAAIEKELEKESKPIRITRTRISKDVGAFHAIVYCIDKLPKTRQIIEEYQETTMEFACRKIRWAINYLEERGERIITWKIIKVAGFSDKKSEDLKRLIAEQIQWKNDEFSL